MRDGSFGKILPIRRRLMAQHSPRGFTLIEILIVGAIISLFAGLALFSIQVMYDESKRKAVFDETKSIGTAVGIAHNDVGLYPRLNILGTELTRVTFTQGGQVFIRPAFDIYGTLTADQFVTSIQKGWRAPYTSVSEARRSFSQGSRLLVKMRLPESDINALPENGPMGRDVAYVDWPADVWGSPYVIYAIKYDAAFRSPSTNPQGIRLIRNAGEVPDWVAVVSYGPNRIPGGTDLNINRRIADDQAARDQYQQYVDEVLIPARLYVPGDLVAGTIGPGAPEGIYTLKSYRAAGELSLNNAQFLSTIGRSIYSVGTNANQIGMRDEGSDDIWWAF